MYYLYKYRLKESTKNLWEYRIVYKDPITQKRKEKSKKGFNSRPEAQCAAEEMERQLREGLEQTNESLKFFLETWLNEFKKGTVARNTYVSHSQNIKNHILPYFQNILLKDIKPILYQKFINQLAKQGYSRRTIEIIHSTMHNACEKAVLLNKIEKNPCVGVTLKGEKKEKQIQFIESDHISDFLLESREYGYHYWLFFKVLIETGMRKGEAAALQWSDIDLKNKIITVNKTLDFQEASRQNIELLFGDTKTFHSKRSITISQGLVNDLLFHKKYQNQNKLALKERYHHHLNLVLCRKDGNYLPKSSLHNAFKKILRRCNLPDLPIHSTRHTHAVLLLESGADMKYIQDRLGHGSMQITADVYSHISKKIDQNSMEKFEDYIENIIK